MTEDELIKILNGDELLKKIDIKTLILDQIMKHTTMDELVEIFYKKLPGLDEAYVKRFIYMKRK